MAKQDTDKKRKNFNWAIVLLFVHVFLLASVMFTAWPEMTLWPYLITKGWLPYRDIAIAHTPLLLVDLTILYKIFGVGIWQLKIYTWLLILLTDALLYWVAEKIWNKKIALLSLVFFIPLQLFYEGNGLWFDLALAPIALMIYHFLKEKDYYWAGIFWALAFFTKQTAFWFLIPIGLTLIQQTSLKKLPELVSVIKKYSLGVIITFLSLISITWLLGFSRDFFYWAFEFGIGILPKAQGQINFPSLRQLIISSLPFSILFFAFFTPKRKESVQLLLWVVAGALGAFPRWELFHFQPALPFLALTGGLILSQANKQKPFLKILLIGYLVLNLILVSKSFVREWGGGTRFFESEISELVTHIEEKVESGEKIYVLNAWDSVYAWSGTLPAVTPWIPHLPWYMESPGVQENIVLGLDIVRPNLILQGEYAESGLGSYRPTLIDEFIQDNYEINDNIGNYLLWTLIK